MFMCHECERFFDEPKVWTERHGETFCACPFCGGGFEEAKKCDYCGEYFIESERNDTCQECIDDLKSRYKKVILDAFTDYEIELLELVL